MLPPFDLGLLVGVSAQSGLWLEDVDLACAAAQEFRWVWHLEVHPLNLESKMTKASRDSQGYGD